MILALDELQMSIELNPNLAPAQFSLSRTLMAAGVSQEGIEAADIARRLSPNDPMRFAMLSVRANCLAQLGEFDEAVKWVQQATHQSNAHFHILAIAVYIASAAGIASNVTMSRKIPPTHSGNVKKTQHSAAMIAMAISIARRLN